MVTVGYFSPKFYIFSQDVQTQSCVHSTGPTGNWSVVFFRLIRCRVNFTHTFKLVGFPVCENLAS